MTWELARDRVGRDFFAARRVSELASWTDYDPGERRAARRADVLRRRARQVRADHVGGRVRAGRGHSARAGQPARRGAQLVHIDPLIEAASRRTIVPHEFVDMATFRSTKIGTMNMQVRTGGTWP
jgi:hypothetical protein